MTCVYVLSGAVGYNRCHVEIFEGTDNGLNIATNRKEELQTMNSGWHLTIEMLPVQNYIRNVANKTKRNGER